MQHNQRITIIGELSEVPRDEWNRLAGPNNPFLRHEFLSALEQHRCLQEYGWYPQHILLHDDQTLIGAAPMYIKDNSYGEMVFDWGWAEAYQRAGLPYYPKLVSAIPYTPATGPRLLCADAELYPAVAEQLMKAAISHAEHHNMSSVHWLFTDKRDTALLQNKQLLMRLGTQFHWENHQYENFDHFLESLSADKRKKIKRERRRVEEQQIQIETRHGDEMTDELWNIYHRFYCSTFERKSGMPTLSLDFFRELATTMPRSVVVMFAIHDGKYVASAFNIRGTDTLYGRHWGCTAEFHSLHFEACYYQGLEYCITNKLQRFEPGAQGEHKLSRGFLPTATWSAHWIANPQFRDAINAFVTREQSAVRDYMEELNTHSPYKSA